MFASLSLGLALLPLAFGAVHDVQVGQSGQLLFQPEAIVSYSLRSSARFTISNTFYQFAAPGDQVVFHFHPKNHTVTQSSFADPCGRKEGGFTSGL